LTAVGGALIRVTGPLLTRAAPEAAGAPDGATDALLSNVGSE
jgi:hypothetical protein